MFKLGLVLVLSLTLLGCATVQDSFLLSAENELEKDFLVGEVVQVFISLLPPASQDGRLFLVRELSSSGEPANPPRFFYLSGLYFLHQAEVEQVTIGDVLGVGLKTGRIMWLNSTPKNLKQDSPSDQLPTPAPRSPLWLQKGSRSLRARTFFVLQ